MNRRTQAPIVYMSCVNSFRKGKRIRHLSKERKFLKDLLTAGRHQALFETVIEHTAHEAVLFDPKNSQLDLNRIKILHFHGQAHNDHLRVAFGQTEYNMHIFELAKFVSSLPHLELVYLHGCATPMLMEMLIRRDVPAIMVTEMHRKDSRAMHVAKIFYSEIARGANIHKAIMSIRQKYARFGKFGLRYNEKIDEIRWPAELLRGKIPWGLYYLKENEARLYQPLSLRTGQGVSLPIVNTKGMQAFTDFPKYQVTAAAMLGMILGLSLYYMPMRAEILQALLSF